MLLKLSSEILYDLQLIKDLDVDYTEQFCQLALGLISGKGIGTASYNVDVTAYLYKISQSAAKKLQREPAEIERCIQALAFLLLSSSKYRLSPEEFQFSLFDLSVEEPIMNVLSSAFQEQHSGLRELLVLPTKASTVVASSRSQTSPLSSNYEVDDSSAPFGDERGPSSAKSAVVSAALAQPKPLMQGEERLVDLRWRLDIEVDSRLVRNHAPKASYLLQLETSNGTHHMQAQYQDLVHMTQVVETAIRELYTANVRRVKTYISK